MQELGRVKADLDTASKSAETLRAYRESFPANWAVNAAGHRYDVPTDVITSQLETAEKHPDKRSQQLAETRDYLDSLAAQAGALSAEPPPPQDSARSKLDSILARREYAHVHQQSWYDRIRAQINDFLLRLLTRILRSVGGPASVGYALLWIAIAAATIFIAYWVFRRWFRTAKAQELALDSTVRPVRSWQEWVFAAREAADRRDYRMAIHCAYWAGIARLQESGALAPDRAKTPREYLRALNKSKVVLPEGGGSRREALSLLTTRLERTWYGYQAATEAEFRDSLSQLETLGCQLT